MEPLFNKVFSCCIPVKGYIRGTICDVQREKYYFIPNTFCEFLSSSYESGFIKNDLQNIFDSPTCDDAYKFLTNNEIIFSCPKNDRTSFPLINMKFKTPFHFTNCILDYSEKSTYDIFECLKKIDMIGIQAIQIRLSLSLTKVFLRTILEETKKMNINSIQLCFPYVSFMNQDFLNHLILSYTKLTSLVIFNSPDNYFVINNQAQISCTKNEIIPELDCGVIRQENLRLNLTLFSEAQKYNTCLNCKLSINVHGEIKNCPSLTKKFGSINTLDINKLIKDDDFKKNWAISKDQIEVCKDCEFRYMCTDCRAFLKDPGNIYSQPTKCEYNPYIAKWKGEDGYVPVEECGSYMNEKFIIFEEKIAALNKLLWE